jgi:hypothetical protein
MCMFILMHRVKKLGNYIYMCVCVYVCAYVYACAYTCMHLHMRVRIYSGLQPPAQAYILMHFMYVHICAYRLLGFSILHKQPPAQAFWASASRTRIYSHAFHVCTDMCTFVYICTCLYAYIYIYIYIYIYTRLSL